MSDVFTLTNRANGPTLHATDEYLGAVSEAQHRADNEGHGSHYVITTWRRGLAVHTEHIYGRKSVLTDEITRLINGDPWRNDPDRTTRRESV